MKKILVVYFLAIGIVVFGQTSRGSYGSYEAKGIIKGVIKGEHGELVEYATISVFSKRDSSLISGSISQKDGTFQITEVPYGRFYAEISFVGFDKTIVKDIFILPNKLTADIGNVIILPTSKSIGEVEIVADKPHIEYKIDKKVVSVGQDISAAGGTAVDVLENVPSIQTDIEGNVSVRGSSNFTVYIDGRPSILEGSDALQQIPASAIDNIEIITNPSAKYEAEGTGGIINVIMKKRRGQGLNGIVNTSIGTKGKYNTDVLLNYRTQNFNIYGGLDYNRRTFSMEGSSNEHIWDTTYLNEERTLFRIDTTDIFRSNEGKNIHDGYGFKLGVDYFINSNNTFSISGAYDKRSGHRNSNTWRDEIENGIKRTYYTENFNDRTSDNFEMNVNYTSKFNDKGHELTASFNYEGEMQGSGHDEGLKEYLYPDLVNPVTSYNNGDKNPEYELRFKTDYVNPFSEHGKVETGIQIDVDQADYDYHFQNYDFDLSEWQDIDSLSQLLEIDRTVYSAYGLYSNRIFWDIDIQGGLRMEYTNRIVRADKDYVINRPDFFPSLHMSKSINKQNQLMMGYTRRIMRPREWDLNPIRRYWDTRNIREGNPELEPEYSNMYEINYQYSKNASFVSFELYHRNEQNLMDRTIKKLNDSINLRQSTNVGERFSTGLEIMGNLNIKRMLTINGSFSIFNDRIESPLQNENVDAEQFSWRTRLNATYITPWKGRLQLNGSYNAASITAQGERDGFFVMNAGYRQDLLDRKLTAIIQVRDIFQSMNFSDITYLDDRIIESKRIRESPVITLTLSYKINNYKSKERNGQSSGYENGGDSEGGGDDMF